jgi:hypothetical protein
MSTFHFTYTKTPDHGWVPTAWQRTKIGRYGQLLESETMNMHDYKVNQALERDTFDLQFPPGTWVNDADHRSYILRPDGTKRVIIPGEFNGHNYKQLLEEDLPSQARMWMLLGIKGARNNKLPNCYCVR